MLRTPKLFSQRASHAFVTYSDSPRDHPTKRDADVDRLSDRRPVVRSSSTQSSSSEFLLGVPHSRWRCDSMSHRGGYRTSREALSVSQLSRIRRNCVSRNSLTLGKLGNWGFLKSASETRIPGQIYLRFPDPTSEKLHFRESVRIGFPRNFRKLHFQKFESFYKLSFASESACRSIVPLT